MDLLVQLSRDLQKAKMAGLVRVSSTSSVYTVVTNNPVVVTTIQFVKPPTEDQMTKLYAYMKGCYNNILLDLRAFPGTTNPRLELLTKDDPLTIHHQEHRV